MAYVVIGGPVVDHAQAFADALIAEFGSRISHISTYGSHQPTRERALDIFPRDKAAGDAVLAFYKKHYKHYGGDYAIWWQRIWNPEVSPNDRLMADRGGKTQNHYDHIHVSFEKTGAATPVSPSPQPREALVQGLIFLHSSRALDVPNNQPNNGVQLQQWDINSGTAQQFKLVDASGGFVYIQHVPSKRVLSIADNSAEDGGRVVLWDNVGNDNQKFRFERRVVDGIWVARNKHSGKVLDVAGGNPSRGAKLVQWKENGGNNQLIIGAWITGP